MDGHSNIQGSTNPINGTNGNSGGNHNTSNVNNNSNNNNNGNNNNANQFDAIMEYNSFGGNSSGSLKWLASLNQPQAQTQPPSLQQQQQRQPSPSPTTALLFPSPLLSNPALQQVPSINLSIGTGLPFIPSLSSSDPAHANTFAPEHLIGEQHQQASQQQQLSTPFEQPSRQQPETRVERKLSRNSQQRLFQGFRRHSQQLQHQDSETTSYSSSSYQMAEMNEEEESVRPSPEIISASTSGYLPQSNLSFHQLRGSHQSGFVARNDSSSTSSHSVLASGQFENIHLFDNKNVVWFPSSSSNRSLDANQAVLGFSQKMNLPKATGSTGTLNNPVGSSLGAGSSVPGMTQPPPPSSSSLYKDQGIPLNLPELTPLNTSGKLLRSSSSGPIAGNRPSTPPPVDPSEAKKSRQSLMEKRARKNLGLLRKQMSTSGSPSGGPISSSNFGSIFQVGAGDSGAGPTSSAIKPVTDRVLKTRQSALRAREKQKEKLSTLERDNLTLKQRQKLLEEENMKLKQEIQAYNEKMGLNIAGHDNLFTGEESLSGLLAMDVRSQPSSKLSPTVMHIMQAEPPSGELARKPQEIARPPSRQNPASAQILPNVPTHPATGMHSPTGKSGAVTGPLSPSRTAAMWASSPRRNLLSPRSNHRT
mmetsp:Transcript_15151/g.26427  ORF Transcript_15151/g.26427 Transcript_15151/m.26427 type:complete len:646 (-) Transcript_15151:695-2632(-)